MIPVALRCAYDLSCWLYWGVAAVMVQKRAHERSGGGLMLLLLLVQAPLSWLNDSFEFMSTGKPGVWAHLDRTVAALTAVTSLIFAARNLEHAHAAAYAFWLGVGGLSWAFAMVAWEWDWPLAWASLHTIWHIVPTAAAVAAVLTLPADGREHHEREHSSQHVTKLDA